MFVGICCSILRHVKVSQPGSHGLAHHGPGQKTSEPNPAHFKVSQIFCNPAQPTMSWWVKWVGSPTHLKIEFFFQVLKYF